jgi:hypothetical protein
MKETEFLSSFDDKEWSKDIDEYDRFFNGADREDAIGEITVNYLTDKEVPERTHQYFPDMKLVVSLRNPIDQVYSHFWHLNRQNFHQWFASPKDGRMSFEEALDKYRDRLLGPAFFSRHLQRWLRYFDRSQLHVILYDDIAERPEEVLTALYAFVGVDASFRPKQESESTGSQVRQGTSPRSPGLHQLYLRLYAYVSRGPYHRLKLAIGVDRANRIKEVLRLREIAEKVFRRKGYPPMKASTRRELAAVFADDVRNLGELVGRDLSGWLK